MGSSQRPVFLYFGYDGSGHHMVDEDGERLNKAETPWGYSPDGTLCPAGAQVEGLALLHHKDGWTALSFWDRSGDTRGNSNTNFLAPGTYDFDGMLALAKTIFPTIFWRLAHGKVEIKLAPEGTKPNGDD